jgi:class 3 adenylate cyclase
MRDLSGFKDGDTSAALVCFTDIAGFARTAETLSLRQISALLKRVSSIISKHVGAAAGRVVKYIGDASLLVFPEQDVQGSVLELLSMKREIEEYFGSSYPNLAITFSAHFGQIIHVSLEPFTELDILGDTVNRAWLLGNRAERGGLVISREVYERLGEPARSRFRLSDSPDTYAAV